MKPALSVRAHPRDVLGMRYVYAVRSRRAGGISIGINLSPNRRCNWRCLYCQVEDLARGASPPCDPELLATELEAALARFAGEEIRDIAFSGDGEPLSCPNVSEVAAVVAAIRAKKGLQAPVRVITNGSYLLKPEAQKALQVLAKAQGELWVKLDAGTREAMQRVNGVAMAPEQWLARWKAGARVLPAWVQTCAFRLAGRFPDAGFWGAYLALLEQAHAAAPVQGVLLYTVARAVQVAPDLVSPASPEELQALAACIRALGISCRVFGA